jgi:hypothetical protein
LLSAQFLWFLDDVLYPAHRSVALPSPVFILAPPRTGSTSLHRALVCDEARFFAPLTLELFFPFIIVARALHFVHNRPRLRRQAAEPVRTRALAHALTRSRAPHHTS